MKTYLKISTALLLPVLYYFFLTGFSGKTEPTNLEVNTAKHNYTGGGNPRDFRNFLLNTTYGDSAPFFWDIDMNGHLDSMKELNFNAIHFYEDIKGSHRLGYFSQPSLTQTQINNVNNLEDLIHSAPYNMQTAFERIRISQLCYGQRLVYEVSPAGSTTENYGFSYQNVMSGTYTTDSGRTVLMACASCPPSSPGAGWLANNIYENTQHTDLYMFRPQNADTSDWFVKPMMRIDSSVVDNFPNKPVAKINVTNFQGDTIKSVILRAKHFLDNDGNYNGRYVDMYTLEGDTSLTVKGSFVNGLNEGYVPADTDPCKVDFKVYWMGEVDVWFDKMTVDDQFANRLFNPDVQANFDLYIQQEVTEFPTHNIFFTDEMSSSNAHCIKYVQDKMHQYNPNSKLYVAFANGMNIISHRNKNIFAKALLDIAKPDIFCLDASTLVTDVNSVTCGIPINSFTDVDSRVPTSWKQSNANYTNYLQNLVFGDKNTTVNSLEDATYLFLVDKITGQIQDFSPATKLYIQPQIHSRLKGAVQFEYDYREPLNEEIQAQAMIAIARGAEGLSWFWYPSTAGCGSTKDYPRISHWSDSPNDDTCHWEFGMLNAYSSDPRYPSLTKRIRNCYGQDKWNYVKDMNAKIANWKPTLDNITWSSGWSVHSEGAGHEFIENFVSIVPHLSGQNPCETDGPGLGEFADCAEERYWEMGFFDGERNNRYFMLVNRRCVPEDASGFTPDNRFVRIKFNGTNLPGSWKNWQLSEVGGNNTRPIAFSRYGGYVDLGTTPGSMGWFKPGEGKLFKISPTGVTGGDLVCDEVITGESFTCEDTIFNNGYNITIGAGTNMKFTDSSCIVMNGGVFTMGDQQVSGPQNITFDAESGNFWRGHSFTGTEVHIYGATFTGLANDSVYALNMVDCPVVDIRGTTFNTAGTLKGAVNAVYYANDDGTIVNFYAGGNTFTATGSTIPTVNVSSFAGTTTPLIIENNIFTNGNTAVFLSGITGGAVKSNNISENYTGISLLSSYVDVSGNTISSTVNGSTGIFAAGGSEVKMNPAGPKKFGGLNNISNEGTGTNNVKVEGSYFLTDGGQNVFNISDISTSYHLYGYFPSFISIPTDERVNCFKVSGSPVVPPYNYVTDGYQGSQLSFSFSPYLTGCDPEGGDSWIVLDMGNGIYDTVYTDGSGSGGSKSSRNQIPLLGGVSRETGRGGFVVQPAGEIYDSVCVLMRSRNYTSARVKCIEMISNYPDSIQSLNAIAKLYLASVSSNANITELKTFYENLILNHPNNTSLVKRANYYILKCKVRLHEYTSALAGFQQIINENPYSYEGLIAKWDYMATSLLVPGAGSFGSEPTVSVLDENSSVSIDIVNALQREAEDDDRSPFTKEQRIDIRKSINTAIENDRNDNDRKIKSLETRSDQGNVNAIKELAQVRALKQVVKTEKPKNITEHIKLVSEDIQKVFGNVTGGKGKDMSNIPTVYRLSQNYPNPFNPVTKINYDLPKDAKVKIVIYDILGREVKRLVNNEQKTAGTYKIDFQAVNYASGVYFYRIEAEESNGNKFVDSKKMVLLK